jgi:hypothetical protein
VASPPCDLTIRKSKSTVSVVFLGFVVDWFAKISWSAVARGAVARGLEPAGGGMVELRRCRLHYGTPVVERFVPTKHQESDAFIDELTGEKRAKGIIKTKSSPAESKKLTLI